VFVGRIRKYLKCRFDLVTCLRHLTELRLWELSCVTFPLNQSAQVSAVKALSDDERAELLEDDDNDKSFLAELKHLAEQAQDLASV
jgi:phage head maturation protease